MIKKNKLLRSIAILASAFYCIQIKAQSNLIGKKFTTEIGVACKEFNDGSCLLHSFCSLDFKKDSVHIYFSQKASCTDKQKEAFYEKNNLNPKTYLWTLKQDQIEIIGFSDYGNLLIGKDKLTGEILRNKLEKLEFVTVVDKSNP